MLEKDRSYRNVAGYSWDELIALYRWLYSIMPPNTEYAHSYYLAVYWMDLIENSDEWYSVPFAFALVAAIIKKAFISILVNSYGVFSEKDCYKAMYVYVSNIKPQYETVHTLMHFLYRESESNLIIPAENRSVLAEIVKDYDVGNRYENLDELRNSLLKYIDSVRGSFIDKKKKTCTIQSCCYVLSLFH